MMLTIQTTPQTGKQEQVRSWIPTTFTGISLESRTKVADGEESKKVMQDERFQEFFTITVTRW